MNDLLTILCDVCKKRPYITTIAYKGIWVGVCKECKKKIEKECNVKKNIVILTKENNMSILKKLEKEIAKKDKQLEHFYRCASVAIFKKWNIGLNWQDIMQGIKELK